MKKLGYTMAHIWACPPSEGDDYIFHCHPAEQKIPKPKRLQVCQLPPALFVIFHNSSLAGVVQEDAGQGHHRADRAGLQRHLQAGPRGQHPVASGAALGVHDDEEAQGVHHHPSPLSCESWSKPRPGPSLAGPGRKGVISNINFSLVSPANF